MHFISPDVSFRHAMHYSNDFKKKNPASIRKSDMYTSAQQSEIFNGSKIRRTYTSTQRWSGINNIHNEATAARIIGYRLDRKDEGV
jgi:hypothetical protein